MEVVLYDVLFMWYDETVFDIEIYNSLYIIFTSHMFVFMLSLLHRKQL